MKKADDAIKRANGILQKAIDSIIEMRREAEGNYHDTGYGRYYNKMEECDTDIGRLEGYINSARYLRDAEREVAKYRRIISRYKDRMDEIAKEYDGDYAALEIIHRCKGAMINAEMEV